MKPLLLILIIALFYSQNSYAQCTIPFYSMWTKSYKSIHTNQIYLSNSDMLKKDPSKLLDSFYPSSSDSTFKEIETNSIPKYLNTTLDSFIVKNCGSKYRNKVIITDAYRIDSDNLKSSYPELSKSYSSGLKYYLRCEINIEPLVTLFFHVITDSNNNVVTLPPFKVHSEIKNQYTLCKAYSSILNKFQKASILDVEHISLYYDNNDHKNYLVFRFTDYINKEPKFFVGCDNLYTLTWIKVDLQTGQALLIGENQEKMCID